MKTEDKIPNTFWAHSENDQGNKHDLVDHLLSTAKLAREFASNLELGTFGYILGILHDLGKFHPAFQDYLNNPNAPRTVRDHSSAGTVYSYKNYPLGGILAFQIAGHHSGLSDRAALQMRIKEKKNNSDVELAIQIGIENLSNYILNFRELPNTIPERWKHIESDMAALEVWIRFLFSCLVDADFLDTEKHFELKQSGMRKTWEQDLGLLWKKFESHQIKLLDKPSDRPIIKARKEIYKKCIQAADHCTGIFKLCVPTGMGKTLSGMGVALRNAILHGKNRIIVVVPYSSIIDQNAAVYKSIFGEENVLEHHSAVEPSTDEEKEDRRKLASENWDAPIIVTTTVQFFESLFSNKTSSARKIHNIVNSVVILDEFQMLPLELLQPIFSMMRELNLHYGVNFVLSSATPLSLDLTISKARESMPRVVDLVPEYKKLFQNFKRVKYYLEPLREMWSWQRVAEEVLLYKQVMVVVNRKKDALKLFSLIRDKPNSFHLSASMCPLHRKKVLKEIRELLQDQKPVILIATQVVEAGVDIDFPVVLRALGPLDRIVQAAGRCNREGNLEFGKVIIFRPEEGGLPPGSYRTATQEAENLVLQPHIDLHDPFLYENYFNRVYSTVNTGESLEDMRRNSTSPLQFIEVAKRFRMIDSNTITVIVQYDEKVDELLKEFNFSGVFTRKLARRLQSYTVNLFEHEKNHIFKKDPASLNLITEGWYLWTGNYDLKTGLSLDIDYDPSNLSL